MQAVISFGPDGNGTALWTEALPLAELGKLSVTRASNVEFNSNTQQWEVTLTGQDTPSFCHSSRAECIKWEVQHLNERLLNA